jgi:rhomboid protease GluP
VEGQHWVIDLFANRLIIYETGSGDFKNIRDQLEDLLAEEELQRNSNEEMRYNHPASGTYRREPNVNLKERLRAGYRLFTLINTIIIIVNILVFLIQRYTPFFGGEDRILGTGALSWYYVIREKEYYRVITSMFLHADFGHIFNNMLVLFFVGDNLERAVGKLKYLFIYFGAGILAGITSISYNMWKESGQYLIENYIFSIGASGAIFGVVGAMLYIVIVNRGKSEDISTRQMVLFVVFSLYGGIMNTRIDQAAHVGGFLAGIVLAAILYRRTKRGAVAESL